MQLAFKDIYSLPQESNNPEELQKGGSLEGTERNKGFFDD